AAQLELSRGQRSRDATVYAVIAVNNVPLQGAVDEMRVTTVAGSVNGLTFCSSGGAGSGQATSALVGADPVIPQALHGYTQITRTGVLTPNDLNAVSFSTSNGGRLTIGSGGGAI